MTTFANGLFVRARTISLGWLVVAFTVAQLLDLMSALVVAREHRRDRDRRRPGPGCLVLIVGAIAGLVGGLSNTHLTPFLSA